MKRIALCLILLASIPLFAGKQREWHTGKLVSSEQSRMPDDTNVRLSTIKFSYEGTEYVAEMTIKAAWHHGPSLTENGDLKWVLDGDHVFILDDNGKEFRYRLLKKRKS